MPDKQLDFQTVYATFQPKVHRYLSRMLDETEAEELTQEVLTKVAKSLKDFRGEAQLSTWVYRIATNTALDRLRSASFKQRQREEVADDSSCLKPVESTDKNAWTGEKRPDAEHQVIRKEMNRCIREYIDRLPENYRVVLILSEVEGFTNPQIAEILQISLDSAKVRLHRARAKLKESLGKHCNFYLDNRGELACDRKKSPIS